MKTSNYHFGLFKPNQSNVICPEKEPFGVEVFQPFFSFL